MKTLLLALLALTGCTHLQPCEQLINSLEQDQIAHGRVMVQFGRIAPGVVMGIYKAPSSDDQYAILFSSPGALIPPGDPFEFIDQCTTPQGEGRVFRAKLPTEPKL